MSPVNRINRPLLHLLLALFSSTVLQSAECSEQCGISLASTQSWSQIVGGGEARAHQYPWMTYLELQFVNAGHEDKYAYCGGSLLDSLWILTAAHCFFSQFEGFTLNRVSVVLGAHNLGNHSEPRTVIFAKKVSWLVVWCVCAFKCFLNPH